MSEAVLNAIENRDELFKGFSETSRWSVTIDGDEIGQVWHGERDNVKCWMVVPAVLSFSIPHSGISGGYSRTSKVGCVEDLLQWHNNRPLSLNLDEGLLHCASVNQFGRRHYLLSNGQEIVKAVWCEFNETEKPHQGASGGVGWQLMSYRGHRMICGHEIGDLNEGLTHMVKRVMDTATKSEMSRLAPPPAERFYQADLDAGLNPTAFGLR